MPTKFILNADDFGPLDFINRGVRLQVAKGTINSVQVLVNGDTTESLKVKIQELAEAVPGNIPLDIGVHLTLTSGSPLHVGGNAAETEKLWGKMVKRKQGKCHFKDIKVFNLQYADGKTMSTRTKKRKYYELVSKAIDTEFELQITRLKDIIEAVNSEIGGTKLVLSSVSNHHNVTSFCPDLFEKHHAAAVKHGLAARAPKALPNGKSWAFVNVAMQLSIFTFTKEQRLMMKHMNNSFLNNQYEGEQDMLVKSPSYVEIRHYIGLGTFSFNQHPKAKKVAHNKSLFRNMVSDAKKYQSIEGRDPKIKVVEFVFHLGKPENGEGMTKSEAKAMVKDYLGIAPKYLDDRIVEWKVLDEIRGENGDKHKEVFDNLASWEKCGEVLYERA